MEQKEKDVVSRQKVAELNEKIKLAKLESELALLEYRKMKYSALRVEWFARLVQTRPEKTNNQDGSKTSSEKAETNSATSGQVPGND